MLLIAGLSVLFLLFAWWHIAENRQIKKDYKDKVDWQMERWLIRFAWSRTIQVLSITACAILIALMYVPQLHNALQSLVPITVASAPPPPAPTPAPANPPSTTPASAPAPSAAATPPPAPTPTADSKPTTPPTPPQQTAPTPAPAIATQNALESALGTGTPLQSTQPPATTTAAAQPAPVKPPEPKPAPVVNSAVQTMDDIYNPEKKSGDAQSSMDDIKKRYEDILVIYMFLKKCGKAKDGDYNIILAALGQEMASVNAPGRMQYDILTSAQGSYKELYSKSACGAGINSLVDQYNDYIKVLSHNVAPH